MFGRSLLLTFILISLAVVVSAKPAELKISVEPAGSAYRVSISFTGDVDGTTVLQLPGEWAGQPDLFKAIRNLSVSKGATLAGTDKPWVKSISHQPAQEIIATYEITQDFNGPLNNAVRYRPVTDPSYIHWIGNTVWVLPVWDEQADVDISIEWNGFPETWTIANSFGTGKQKQKFKAKIANFRSAIFVAGDFRIFKTKAKGNDISIAVRGKWQFTDAEFAETIRKVIETERDFFTDHSQKYYLVTLVPANEEPDSLSLGGTGLTDSFALFATPNATISGFRGLLAHEYAHNWLPLRLGRMPEPEQELYWFSEGFTEFYAYKILRNGGLITAAEYSEAYNELIREYYALPVRGEPNSRIVKDFWNDPNVYRLPYLRGFLFATNLDAEIRKASGGKSSLDDAIRELLAGAKMGRKPLTFELLTGLFSRYLGRDISPDIKRYLVNGELITPRPDGLGPSFAQESVRIPVFELGFNFDKFAKENLVAEVVPNSAAYAAGLRNGQKRNGGVSLTFGDTTKEVELKVKDEAGEKTIRFLPIARGGSAIPQYKPVL